MEKRAAILLALMAGLIAMIAPVAVSLQLAHRQSTLSVTQQCDAIASEVLRRSERTAQQFFDAHAKLTADPHAPCSDEKLALMREIDLTSNYIQAVGAVAGDRLRCSSVGRHGDGIPLGKPDILTVNKVSIWKEVQLPFAKGQRFRVSVRDGYGIIVDPTLAMDVFTSHHEVSVALVIASTGQTMASRGILRSDWLKRLGSQPRTSFLDEDHVVSLRRSERYDLVAVAALPSSYVSNGVWEFARVLLPLGATIGAILVLAIALLAKRQLSLPAALRVGLKANEFKLHYQPLIDMRSGEWVGAEALIRWTRANGEVVRPDLFIPVAEDGGMIEKVTERVLELLTADAPSICGVRDDFHIAINLSATDLHSEQIVHALSNLLAKTGCHPPI